jgi:hypothetical protein
VDVYGHLFKMRQARQTANNHLEEGVIAELLHGTDASKSLKPQAFRLALQDLRSLKQTMGEFDLSVAALQKAHAACGKAAIGAETIRKLLAEEPALPRVTARGARYSDAAGVGSDMPRPVTSLDEILQALRDDLKVMDKVLDEAMAGLRDALPLADKGEFTRVMLSGRQAFGDKMPQFTQMFAAYENFYTRTVGVTVTATMQLYPKGYEWVSRGAPAKPKQ